MSQMRSTFEGLRRKGESAFICYLTAGFPSLQESKEHILACIDGGADIMEVGVPFSIPSQMVRSSKKHPRRLWRTV